MKSASGAAVKVSGCIRAARAYHVSAPMAVEHTNRRRQTYYLHKDVTKAGRANWFFSLKPPESPVETIPEGFEVYESPDGKVFLRKARPKIITDEELLLVRKVIRQCAKTRHVIVERDGKHLVIHADDQERLDDYAQRMAPFVAPGAALDALIQDNARYQAVFRFTLVEGPPREFVAERWCFLGSIDTWHYLGNGTLEDMIRVYAPHIGAESFFDLF